MKKSILLFAFLTFSLLSCSSDDSSDSINSSLLIGKWDLKSVKEADGTPIPLTNCEELYNSEEFFSNNTSIGIWAEPSATGSNCGVQTFNETYTVTNNILSLKEAGSYEFRYVITELTSNKLTIKHIYSEESGAGSGYDIPTEDQVTHYFDKMN